MKKILVPTDFSKNARNAFVAALELAQLFNAEVTLCSMYDQPHTGQSVMRDLSERLTVLTREDLLQEIEDVQPDFPKMHIRTEAVKGETAKMINKTAVAGNYDLVVMGKTGRSGFSHKIFGSVALETIEKTDRPILLIPENWKYKSINKLCLATDLSDIDYKKTLRPLIAFAEGFNAPIEMIHFAEDQDELDELYSKGAKPKSAIEAALDNVKHRFVFGIRKDVRKALFDYINTADFHMMCMIKHEYPWVQKLFHSSPTVDAAINAEVPLLVLTGKWD